MSQLIDLVIATPLDHLGCADLDLQNARPKEFGDVPTALARKGSKTKVGGFANYGSPDFFD